MGWVSWHINICQLFHAKSDSYIYIEYMICKHRENIDNEVIQAKERFIVKQSQQLQCFGSNEPSSGQWGMILVMLNQRPSQFIRTEML